MGFRGHCFVFGVGQKRDIARGGFIQTFEARLAHQPRDHQKSPRRVRPPNELVNAVDVSEDVMRRPVPFVNRDCRLLNARTITCDACCIRQSPGR